jgi:hypothetical protein
VKAHVSITVSLARLVLVLMLLAFSGVSTRPALAQDLGTSQTDVLGVVDTTDGFNDYTGADGVFSYASAELLDLSLLDDCTPLEADSDGGYCWVVIEDQLFQNFLLVADPANDCDPLSYYDGYCGEGESPAYIAVDADADFEAHDNYDIHGWPALAYFDVNNYDNPVYATLLLPDGTNYLDYSFDANPPSIDNLEPYYGVLGAMNGQFTVTGNDLLDHWPPNYVPATPPTSSNGVSFTVASLPEATNEQMTINYKIDSAAPTGNRAFTLSNRFGTSNSVTFTVADASPTFANQDLGVFAAGTQYPINIPGANFGKNPQVSAVGPAGVIFNLSASDITNVITGTISIASGASAGPITITLTSQGASGNGFIGPETPTATARGTVQPLPATAPFLVQRPLYASAAGSFGDSVGNCSEDTPLTQTSYSVVVGEQINLTGCIPANSGIPVFSATWAPPSNYTSAMNNGAFVVGGTAVGGFSVTMDASYQFSEMIINAPSAPNCSTSLPLCDFPTFYFIAQGKYTFQFQYQLTTGSMSPPATVQFVVSAPTTDALGNFFEGVNDGPPGAGLVEVCPAGQYAGGGVLLGPNQPVLAYGDCGDSDSIEVTPSGTPPGGYTQNGWGWTSIITRSTYQYLSAPAILPQSEQGLDTAYDVSNVTFSDAPAMVLDVASIGSTHFTAVGEEAATIAFTTYLLWDPTLPTSAQQNCNSPLIIIPSNGLPQYNPSTCSSIPIPVSSFAWGFAGDAIKTLNANQKTAKDSSADTWYLSGGGGVVPQVGPAQYPIWTSTVSYYKP